MLKRRNIPLENDIDDEYIVSFIFLCYFQIILLVEYNTNIILAITISL